MTDEQQREALGRIIANIEEPVREATARFRQRLYEKALRLRGNKASRTII